MVKGRLWRFLLVFLTLYIAFVLYFFYSFNSDSNVTTTTPISLQKVDVKIIDANNEPAKIQDQNVVRTLELNLTNLEPFMTYGVLGNYEPKNLVKIPGPGENGAGVQLTDPEEKKRGEKSVADYGFNEVASDKISLDRHARDTR